MKLAALVVVGAVLTVAAVVAPTIAMVWYFASLTE